MTEIPNLPTTRHGTSPVFIMLSVVRTSAIDPTCRSPVGFPSTFLSTNAIRTHLSPESVLLIRPINLLMSSSSTFINVFDPGANGASSLISIVMAFISLSSFSGHASRNARTFVGLYRFERGALRDPLCRTPAGSCDCWRRRLARKSAPTVRPSPEDKGDRLNAALCRKRNKRAAQGAKDASLKTVMEADQMYERKGDWRVSDF
mmetsp:Transcript_34851/g.68803  ORF Transcript_34851/g.68803 Transcript_34851/m.68803 type:complete len:204 (-) Transcript_34851:96-707(-)